MFDNVRSDYRRYCRTDSKIRNLRGFLEYQGLWASVCYRAGRHLIEHPLPPVLKQFAYAGFWIWWKAIQMSTGIYLAPTAKIGKGFYIGHFGQIFIGADSTIGENCNVSQGVTLGYSFYKGEWGVPHLGDRVYVAAGAKVIGPVHLANGTVVGANAVVTKDTEENAVVAGVPARVISYKGSAAYIP